MQAAAAAEAAATAAAVMPSLGAAAAAARHPPQHHPQHHPPPPLPPPQEVPQRAGSGSGRCPCAEGGCALRSVTDDYVIMITDAELPGPFSCLQDGRFHNTNSV